MSEYWGPDPPSYLTTWRHRVAERLRRFADRLDHEGAPKLTGWSYRFEDGVGVVFDMEGRSGTRLCYLGDAEGEKAGGTFRVRDGQLQVRSPRMSDLTWHDIEALLRADHDVDDDTFKGSAKDIWNLFIEAGWRPPSLIAAVAAARNAPQAAS